MFQKFKKQGKEESNLEKLREKAAQEIAKVIQPIEQEEDLFPQAATKKVRLTVSQASSCGCGGSTDFEVYREVPEDSDLKDGDTVTDFDDSDELID